ncbi:hypothetical protein C1645_734496 [Glomus cerebriforme]|uniref:Uncharacterized protein n=1 Tax=Glomus cerebriforme TaxID=658196 RepID=A0A397TEU9_9GLOM|nr:hypothetical protein C1645_734496 [Glomus cerebriforme]
MRLPNIAWIAIFTELICKKLLVTLQANSIIDNIANKSSFLLKMLSLSKYNEKMEEHVRVKKAIHLKDGSVFDFMICPPNDESEIVKSPFLALSEPEVRRSTEVLVASTSGTSEASKTSELSNKPETNKPPKPIKLISNVRKTPKSSSNEILSARAQREERLRKWAIDHGEDPDIFMTITEKDIDRREKLISEEIYLWEFKNVEKPWEYIYNDKEWQKNFKRRVNSLEAEIEDLDEYVYREAMIDLIHEIVSSLINEKSKSSAYLSESFEESDSVDTHVIRERKDVPYNRERLSA